VFGFVEKDGKAVDGPASTEVNVQPEGDYLRIGDVVLPCIKNISVELHPLPEDGLLWYGYVGKSRRIKDGLWYAECPGEDERYGEIPRSQVAYATSIYLRDCDIVFFIMECGRVRG